MKRIGRGLFSLLGRYLETMGSMGLHTRLEVVKLFGVCFADMGSLYVLSFDLGWDGCYIFFRVGQSLWFLSGGFFFLLLFGKWFIWIQWL
jgi:hypothetical protein